MPPWFQQGQQLPGTVQHVKATATCELHSRITPCKVTISAYLQLQEAMDVRMKCAFGSIPLNPLEQLMTPWKG